LTISGVIITVNLTEI